MELVRHDAGLGGFEGRDPLLADDLHVRVAEVPRAGFDEQLVLARVEAHELRHHTVHFDRVGTADDAVHLDRDVRTGRIPATADDGVDDGQVRLEQVQKVREFLVDLPVMVTVPHVRRERTHAVLETERDTGVNVGLGLGDGDVQPLALDDFPEALRHIDVLPDFRVGDEVVHHGFLFEEGHLNAVVFGDPVIARHTRVQPGDETGAFADEDIAPEFDQVFNDRVEDTGVGGLRVIFLEPSRLFQVHEDQVRLDEHLATAELGFPAGGSVQVIETLADGLLDCLDVRPRVIRGRAVVLRQTDVVPKVVHRRRLGDDYRVLLILNTHIFFSLDIESVRYLS